LKLSGESVGDAGDPYTGLDRFGRIVDQRWRSGSTDQDRFTYSYDRDGNRLTKTNSLNSAFNETYTYDGLNQIASFARTGRTQSWGYDALGNFNTVTTNGVAQTRTANKQNEIISIGGATTPTFDANGNMTKDEVGRLFVFDAWNRETIVKNSGGTTLLSYSYDARNYRIVENDGTAKDLYYSSGWQLLEERVGGTTTNSYVWSPVYIDAMIARDRDTDANGTLDERLYPTHDANFNVTGVVSSSGSVVERNAYDTFGAVTVYSASFSTITTSAYSWVFYHQGGRAISLSGQMYFRNREYSTTLGRWVTMDPIRYKAGDTNLYSYEGNIPSSRLDASGLLVLLPVIAGGAVGGATAAPLPVVAGGATFVGGAAVVGAAGVGVVVVGGGYIGYLGYQLWGAVGAWSAAEETGRALDAQRAAANAARAAAAASGVAVGTATATGTGGGGGTGKPPRIDGGDCDPKCDDHRSHILSWLAGGQYDIQNYLFELNEVQLMLARGEVNINIIRDYNEMADVYNSRLQQLRTVQDQMKKLGCPDIPEVPPNANPLK